MNYISNIAFVLIAFNMSYAGSIFEAGYTSRSDANVFIVDHKSQAGWLKSNAFQGRLR